MKIEALKARRQQQSGWLGLHVSAVLRAAGFLLSFGPLAQDLNLIEVDRDTFKEYN